jgi:uncharacterized protein YyaL (SSP411 family)
VAKKYFLYVVFVMSVRLSPDECMNKINYLLAALLFGLSYPVWAATENNTVETYLSASKAAGKAPNHLVNESSPYLLQHAYNPVQWYAWGEEAFARAKKENKPIFLSIGYSTCHWCHVMAHESFENKAIAGFLNKHFINVKVDREERPDIDAIYMAATQLINGHGGWPMTVVMNHELEPFFAGTYYPPEGTEGSPGFAELLIEINRLWKEERERVEGVANSIAGRIKADADESGSVQALNKFNSRIALQQISTAYDEDFGGFSAAPKFPRPGLFALLLKLAESNNEEGANARLMMNKTLTAMAQGGIFDQAGGGFHRYSVDRQWQVPHFEKMLYSQALLTMSYVRMYELEEKPLYKSVARATLDYVLREMTSPQGGFYSALDADSERPDEPGNRAEGAFYLWSEKELEELLSSEEIKFVRSYYNIFEEGNIDSDPQGEFKNLNILHVSEEYSDKNLTGSQEKLLQAVKNKLLDKRKARPRPHLDDKIITAWNGMMISAFSRASKTFEDEKYLNAAVNSAEYLRAKLLDKESGRLFRRIRGDEAGIEAGLGDYVWAIRGAIDLYRASGDKRWLDLATGLSAKQNGLFLDENNGGYFDVSGNDSTLLFRSKSIYDGALPSANAVSISNLTDLAEITKDQRWKTITKNLISAFAGAINSNPASTAMALSAIEK